MSESFACVAAPKNGNSLEAEQTEEEQRVDERMERYETVAKAEGAGGCPSAGHKHTLDNEPMTRKPKLKEWPRSAAQQTVAQACLYLGY